MKQEKNNNTEDTKLPDMLRALKDKETFSVDSSYFSEQEERTRTEIWLMNQQDRTNLPYQVSAGYFDRLPNQILNNIRSEHSINGTITKLLVPVYVAAAILALLLASFPFFSEPNLPVTILTYETISDDELDDYVHHIIPELSTESISQYTNVSDNHLSSSLQLGLDEETLLQMDIDADEISSL